MPHVNIYLDEDDFHTLRKLKGILKCRSNEELLKKIIEIAKNTCNNKPLKNKKTLKT